jgi:hypothetical protein
MKNRFINAAGGAEKRQGMTQLGSTVSGTPSLDAIHEMVLADGTEVILVSGGGKIWKFDGTDFNLVHSGVSASAVLGSVQMGRKLIFFNGVDANFFTEDGSTFTDLVGVIERGEATSDTDNDQLHDNDIGSWVTDTNAAVNDLHHNKTIDAYALITALASSTATHTEMGITSPSAIGVGTGGVIPSQQSGDEYEIIDLVELNIIPTDGDDDNVAVASSAAGVNSNAGRVLVSAVSDWTKTDIRTGDYIRNTTRAAVGRVTTIATAQVNHTGMSGQSVGDSLIFLKPAMPLTTESHVHFGRAYYVDQRDQTLIRVSGPNNPEDMTTNAGTLDSTSIKFGDTQPDGDTVLALGSFQRFFCMAGKKNFYFFSGTEPVADTTASSTDFSIIGLFPQGAMSNNALTSIGNDMVWVTPDGVQSGQLVGDASSLGRSNLSEAIKKTLRVELQNTPSSQIKILHYPRRSWLLVKVGSQIHVFNYTAYFGQDQLNSRRRGEPGTQNGSWSLFDGKFARQNAYLVRRNGDLICCGDGGKVYTFDDGSYTDDGEEYKTEYQPGWLTLERSEARSVSTKQGNYIKPVFDTGAAVVYSIKAEAGFDGESSDTVLVSAAAISNVIGTAIVGTATIGGSRIQNTKFPLRWRGEQVRLTFTTEDSLGPDTISRFTLYATKYGRR